MLDTMRCAKCKLTQLAAPACKSCGTATGLASRAPILRSIPPPPPHAPLVHVSDSPSLVYTTVPSATAVMSTPSYIEVKPP